jgi:hypothetical protein
MTPSETKRHYDRIQRKVADLSKQAKAEGWAILDPRNRELTSLRTELAELEK